MHAAAARVTPAQGAHLEAHCLDSSSLSSLPIAAVLPELRTALAEAANVVLEAPPGAGKSTGVPLTLLGVPWLDGRRIVMLQPRRLAARAVARRLARLAGDAEPGGLVGYRTRLDTRVGPATRIEVVTEGILTRRLQFDPALEDTGIVIFDEFHERSLQADLGLALAADAQRHLRGDLRLLVMSATLQGIDLARVLGAGLRTVRAPGRAYPVETRYAPATTDVAVACRGGGLEQRAANTVLRALAADPGDALVFLPGVAEIRRTCDVLASHGEARLDVRPLYGELDGAQQDAALGPAAAGRRKVVVATNIAETSLTIEGVRIVVDSGLERRPRFDPNSAMTRLETVRISRASADQRSGRAGRTAPGTCYRLWTESENATLAAQAPVLRAAP
jgi:ATP-dependent helicase HrpB